MSPEPTTMFLLLGLGLILVVRAKKKFKEKLIFNFRQKGRVKGALPFSSSTMTIMDRNVA
jgi:hypothetical protein